ncbi:MAG: hypothetical protein KF740_00640 [Ramlibacter sp.]|nr:hypothetical protein [Ramlibacter sp.]
MTQVFQFFRVLMFIALVGLTACGGGGGSGGVSPPPPAANAEATQGFWSGPVDAQTTALAVYLAEGPVWTIVQTGTATTALVVGTSTVSGSAFAVAGRNFNLASGATSSFSISGSVVPRGTLSVAAAGTAPAYALVYNKAYESPAQLADISGAWRATFNGGSVVLTLNISGAGVLTGSTNTGCSYTGSVAPHAGGVAVFDLALTESCVGSAIQQFAGITTLNAARTVLSAAFATSNLSGASAFQATR